MEKSLNQQYKESGTTLSYKEWRIREDEKMASFDGFKAPKLELYDTSGLENAQKEMQKAGGFKSESKNKSTFGIPNYVIVLGGVLIVSAIAYKIYSKNK
jgi:hypothetical protein